MKSVLVVEDDRDGQEIIVRMLLRAGIPVEIIGTAEDALQLLSTEEHSTVVIDLALPGMDGFSLLKRIREDKAVAQLPCVAITAFHTPTLKQRALQEGFNAYFAKPLDDRRFIAAVSEEQSVATAGAEIRL